MNNSMKKWLLGSVAASAMVSVLPAMAAESQSTAGAAQAGKEVQAVDEIVITARRRQESILKVPVTVNVLGATQLEQYSVDNLTAVASHVPGLNISPGVASFGAQVSLRGVGTVTSNAATDQSVSLNIDGMQMTQGIAYAMGFFDMAQVQVMKGPQALFYGKASPAGVISIRTADPTNSFEAVVKGGYEIEAREKRGEFVLSGPVVADKLLVRLAASYSDADGFFKNNGSAANLGLFGGPLSFVPGAAAAFGPLGALGGANPTSSRVPETKNRMFRGTVLWNASEDFKARLKVNYAKQTVNGAGYDAQMGSCPDGTAPSNVFGIRFIGGNEDCKVNRYVSSIAVNPAAYQGVYNNGVPFASAEQAFGTLELTYNINPTLTLTSLTGLSTVKQIFMENGSASSVAGPFFVVEGDYKHDDFTQELRLTSNYSGPVNFMVGGFYEDGKQGAMANLPVNKQLGQLLGYAGALGAALGAHNFAAIPGIEANARGFQAFPPYLSYTHHDVKTRSLAAFGQLLFKIVPDLELGIGTRYTDERRRDNQIDLATGVAINAPLLVPEINSKTWSPELSLTYTPTDNLTVFGTAKQAYKSGSFMVSGTFSPTDNNSFGDERVRGAEVGVKGTLLDREVHFSLASYYYKYHGLQVGSNEITNAGNVIIRTRNAAGAKSYGIDFDGSYRPHEVTGLSLNGAVNWNISKYTNFADAPCSGGQTIAQGCNLVYAASQNNGAGGFTAQDLSGKTLMRAPQWSVNVGADYERPVNDGLNVVFGVSTQYTSAYYTNILLRDDMRQGGYFKTNANIALRSDAGWELAVIGNNLGNKIVSGDCINGNYADSTGRFGPSSTGTNGSSPAGVEELECNAEPGRSVMLRLTLRLQDLMHK